MNNFKTYWIFFPFILLTCFRTSESAEITSSPNKEDASYLTWEKQVSALSHRRVFNCTNFPNYWCVSSHLSNLKLPAKWMAKGSFPKAVQKRILTLFEELGSTSLSSTNNWVSLTMSSQNFVLEEFIFLACTNKVSPIYYTILQNLIRISRCDKPLTNF